ncbi:hypothetical protein OH77DRAFT_344952 [Trametes cingulata]|nr:hypothetical protein OH77DRAFT_344952 [Trametes cingulata]
MNLLDLPVEALLEIFSYFYGPKEALPLALLCKRTKVWAQQRVDAHYACTSHGQLQDLVRRMQRPAENNVYRGLSLELLEIVLDTDDTNPQTYPAISLSLLQLLTVATNLRGLVISELFEKCLDVDPRLGDAVAALGNLRFLILGDVSDTTVHALTRAECIPLLENLLLTYYTPSSGRPGQPPRITFTALLKMLAQRRHLAWLHLCWFRPTDTLAEVSQDPNVPLDLPTIRTLRLRDGGVRALDLVLLCRNLHELHLAFDPSALSNEHASRRRLSLPPAIRALSWPRLDRLYLCGPVDERLVTERVNTVTHLIIERRCDITPLDPHSNPPSRTSSLHSLLHACRPLMLDLPMAIRPDTAWGALNEVLKAADSLKVLELRLTLHSAVVAGRMWQVGPRPCMSCGKNLLMRL